MITPYCINFNGDKMYGIQHLPLTNEYPDACVVILSGPGTNRCGPHRLHVDIALMLEQQGIVCYRTDFRGRGESTGDPARLSVHSMMADLMAMLDYIREQNPAIKDCLVIGNCLSAVAVIKVFEHVDFIRACILLGAQELHDGWILKTRITEGWKMINRYFRKVATISAWQKLIRNGIDYKMVGKAIKGTVSSNYRTNDQLEKQRVIEALKQRVKNQQIAHARYICFIYGELDTFRKELTYYAAYSRKKGWSFHQETIKDGDRTFTQPTAGRQVIALINTYFLRYFPVCS